MTTRTCPLTLHLADIPFIDHHSHSWLRGWQQQSAEAFRGCFTESRSTEQIRDHVGHSLPYRQALRALSKLIGCESSEQEVLKARGSIPEREYLERLFNGAHIECILLDDGYPPAEQSLSGAEVARASGSRVGRIIRIETLVEAQLRVEKPFEEAVKAFDAVAQALAESGAAGLKTIAAYRSGLNLEPVSASDAKIGWERELAQAAMTTTIRVTSKPVIDFFAIRGLAHASDQHAAFQVHTGVGDSDLDLLQANPLHLRPTLESKHFAGAKVVLLHGAYPYTREAAYLSSIYANVYLDFSTALPPLGLGEIQGSLLHAINMTPMSKLLLSSDAADIPEHHALGARAARHIVRAVLTSLGDRGELTDAEMLDYAARMLGGNARSVYGSMGLMFG